MRFAVVLGLLAGCGLEPGEACEATGDGFTRRDPCRTQCVGWDIACADGTAGVPAVCSGDGCAADGDCPDGWGCAAVNATDRECLPLDACPGGYAQ